MDNINKYAKLKADIIALKEYVVKQYGTELSPRIDNVLAEINDLLFGLEQGQLRMPYKDLRMASAWSATDGTYEDDKTLAELIYKIQADIYSIKRHIVVLAKYKLFSRKKGNDINWLFPNLDCSSGKIHCISYRDEDMLTISFPNGYKIDLGFVENEYSITVTKNNDWTHIVEKQPIKLRSAVEENLQKIIYKYENL